MQEVDGRSVFFVVAEGDEGEDEVGKGYGERDEVEGAPCAAVRYKSCRHQWTDGTTDTVAAMHAAKSCRALGKVGTEDVIRRQVRRYPQPKEEKCYDHNGKRRLADKYDITGCHYRLSQYEHFRPPQASLKCLCGWSSTYKSDSVSDEDERDDGIANIVVLLDVRDQGSRGGIIQAIPKIHETA